MALGQLGLWIGRDPDRWARLLAGLRFERQVAELIEAALVAHAVLGPEPAQDRDAFLEAGPAVRQPHLERRELGLGRLARQAAADARPEDHPSARDVVERSPLGGEQQSIAQRKR